MKINCQFPGVSLTISGPDNDSSVMTMIQRDGVYEPWLISLLERLLKPNSVMIDVGANVGVISLFAGKLCKNGKVYAFEPQKDLYAHLQTNSIENHVPNVVAYQLAVDDKGGKLFLHREGNVGLFDYGGAMLSSSPDEESEEVSCISLDSWVTAHSIDRLDFIKVDVEGMELSVLQGATSSILKYQPILLVEFYPDKLKKTRKNGAYSLFQFVRSMNYKVGVIHRWADRIVPVDAYSELRGMMMTGHGVEDLVCIPEHEEIDSEMFSPLKMISTYNGSYLVSVENRANVHLFGAYEDGWIDGGQAALLINPGADELVLEMRVVETVRPLVIEVSWDDQCQTYEILPDALVDIKIELSKSTTVFVEASETMAASEFFKNDDPRRLSLRFQYSLYNNGRLLCTW